jgi:RNA polymerase sigma-70 factor (ECF subfamily)
MNAAAVPACKRYGSSMEKSDKQRITQVLQGISSGEGDGREATDWLFKVLYGELRGLAGRLMRGEARRHTLQPTALVNEAYLKLFGQTQLQWQDRAHFLNVAAQAMRQVLVDYARRRNAAKRGGRTPQVTINGEIAGNEFPELEILALDDALDRMKAANERMGRVVELRVFAGMKTLEIALILDISRRTVTNDWRFAKIWLSRELKEASS